MPAFNAALAIFMQAHGAVTASDDAPGIPQSLDGMLINSLSPESAFAEKIKIGRAHV